MSTEPQYTFKEFWEERFARLNLDIQEIKGEVKALSAGQSEQGKEVASLKGKMLVYGSLSIVAGSVIAALVIKGLGM